VRSECLHHQPEDLLDRPADEVTPVDHPLPHGFCPVDDEGGPDRQLTVPGSAHNHGEVEILVRQDSEAHRMRTLHQIHPC
jgi:hypothetical protein